ncbi:segregation/condensation protein A [Candidatus Micrarchaeota archaeon]|nr:segregation/condensation protein A [Candidatus Micrarchaeota archaeon]
MDLPITSIVAKPSWKQVLIELVMTEKLDPWNIDIVVVADSFFNYVKKMEKFDFHIPANIILACAILLKYKSNAIRFYAEPQLADAPMEESAEGAIPELTLSWRIPPKRQITLKELMGEMERVIKYDSVERPKKVAAQMPTLELDLDNYDIESEIDKLYVRLKGDADSEGIVLFSSLINGGGADGVVSTITPLLHLAQRKSVYLRQDKFFGEIFINLNGNDTNGKEGNGTEGNRKSAEEPDSLPEPQDAELEAGEAELGAGAEDETGAGNRPEAPAAPKAN